MKNNRYLIITIAIVTTLVFAKPLFHPGLIAGHDTWPRIVHIKAMAAALKDGQFPVRWVEGLAPGLSHPLFNYYPPLYYYFPALLTLIGAPLRDAIYISLVAFLILGWYGMYKFTNSFIAASLFSLTPYRLSQIYVRAVYMEFAATSLIPFVFWGVQKRNWQMTAVALGLMLFIHQPTFIMVFPALLAWIAFLWIRDNSTPALVTRLISMGLGLLLVSTFVLPLFWERKDIHTNNLSSNYFDYHQHFAKFSQLIYSPWGYGISQEGSDDGMSFQVGILNWLGVLLALYLFFKNKNPEIIFWIGVAAYGAFMATTLSGPVWETVPLLAFLQYPWRFLVITTFATSVIAGNITPPKPWMAIAIIFLMALFSWKYLAPAAYLATDNLPSGPLYGLEPGYFPIQTIQTNSDPGIPRFRVIQGQADIKSLVDKTTLQKFETTVLTPTTIQINTHYFPGWIARIDDQITTPGFSFPEGNLEVTLDRGKHTVTLEFTDTLVRRIGNYLSLGTGVIIFFSLFWSKYFGAIRLALKKSPWFA